MTANRKRVGMMAVGLFALLAAAGCTEEDDVIASGNVVATYGTSAINPTSTDYRCITIEFSTMNVKPTDGICDPSSDFYGRPCGTNVDCSESVADCDYAMACQGSQAATPPTCATTADCAITGGGTCEDRGECTTDTGIGTGVGCFLDIECNLGEVCGGECSAGSATPGAPCVTRNDCTAGECIGAQAADSLEGSQIVQIADQTRVEFTQNCSTCELGGGIGDCFNEWVPDVPDGSPTEKFSGFTGQTCSNDEDCAPCPASPDVSDPTEPGVECSDSSAYPECGGTCDEGFTCIALPSSTLCSCWPIPDECTESCSGNDVFCTSDSDCTNRCLPASDPRAQCQVGSCCQQFNFVAQPCTEDADCPANDCVGGGAGSIASVVLTEGRYSISTLSTFNLRLFAPEEVPALISCGSNTDVASQYRADEPLHFTIGPNRANDIRFVVDITNLESLLDQNCAAAVQNYPAWMDVVSH